jgi:hypothetical protein
MGKNMAATMCTECEEGLCYYGSTVCSDCLSFGRSGMFVAVKQVEDKWKIATVSYNDRNRIDWEHDEFTRETVWCRDYDAAIEVASNLLREFRNLGGILLLGDEEE